MLGLVVVALFESIIHRIVDTTGSLPFLPLMIMSVYTAVGVLYAWLYFALESFKSGIKKPKTH